MRKTMIISIGCLLVIFGSVLMETKVLGKVYLKYYLCREELFFGDLNRFFSRIQEETYVNSEEIIELKKRLCNN